MEPDHLACARRAWGEIRADVVEGFQRLWEFAELPNMEYRSAAYLSDWLEREGFTVKRAAYGLPTAFVASWRRGDGPRIALLAEYDALPGTGNQASASRLRTDGPAGHACGHNQIGPANAGAAIAARRALEQLGIGGQIEVIGCPAEEIVWGKVALLKAGAFEGLDAILTSHADYQNGAISRPCQSVVSGEFVFMGSSGHGGAGPKRNALDAAELAVQSIERLRAHHFADTIADHVLRVGGHIPNVSPDEARIWMTSRQVDFQRASSVYDFIVGVARQAAQMCGVGFREQFIAATRGYLANDTLAHVLARNIERIGPPRWSNEDIAWMAQLVEATGTREAMALDRKVALHDSGHDLYGQDDGEASWRIPLGRVNWAVPRQVPLHNWAFTALCGHPSSHAGPLMASEALSTAALELFQTPTILDMARAELGQRTDGAKLGAPRIGAWKTMTESPGLFWNGTWEEQ
jgi:aminobenzoyl-glutamate utilization protein B